MSIVWPAIGYVRVRCVKSRREKREWRIGAPGEKLKFLMTGKRLVGEQLRPGCAHVCRTLELRHWCIRQGGSAARIRWSAVFGVVGFGQTGSGFVRAKGELGRDLCCRDGA